MSSHHAKASFNGSAQNGHGPNGADARGLWWETAEPAIATPPLTDDARADIVVVGAGCTGLSAALHAAEAGADVLVLDAGLPGEGASGRAGGEVLPGLKIDPKEMVRRWGAERGERLAQWAGDTPSALFDLAERHGIDCRPERNGWLQVAYTRRQMKTLEQRCRDWQSRGAPVELVDGETVAAMAGTRPGLYCGGWLDRRGGSIHPLAFVRGLVRAAADNGARIHGGTPVASLERQADGWRLTTESGHTVSAANVIVATNAYSGGLVPDLARSVIPLKSCQAASAPLSPELLGAILPERQVASDRRRMLVSFRLSPDQRLLIGGPGGTGEAEGEEMLRNAERTADELFGHLGPIRFEIGWSGYVALTRDFVPHVHEPEPGLFAACGYNGRGLALSTGLGKALGQRVTGLPADELPMPVSPISTIPFARLAPAAVSVAERFAKQADRIERRLDNIAPGS